MLLLCLPGDISHSVFLDNLVQTLHIANDSNTIKSIRCNRTKGSYLLTKCLAVYCREVFVAKLQNSKGFSILCDKSTDISCKKIFCVNVRIVDSSENKPVTSQYRLLEVHQGDADGLFATLSQAFIKDGLSFDKVVGYASGGENLMQGQSNSLLTRMKGAAPNLFLIKC